MNKNNPLVSILIPAYNGSQFIHRALESAINQTYKNIEIIITDDCSSDNIKGAVEKFIIRDKRIKYFRNDFNLGGQKNFFKAIELSSGDYVYPLCQDDWLSKNCINNGIKEINLHPEVGVVFNSVIHLNSQKDGTFIPQYTFIPKDRIYSTKFFFTKGYKSKLAEYSGFAFYKRADLIDIKNFMFQILEDINYIKVKNYGFWGEVLIPLKILSKYDYFSCIRDSIYVKFEHSNNYASVKKAVSFSERIEISKTIRKFYELVYKNELNKFLSGFRVDYGVREINNILISVLKREFTENYSIFTTSKKSFLIIDDYTEQQKFRVIIKAILTLFLRFVEFVVKKLKFKKKESIRTDVNYQDIFLIKNNETDGFFFDDDIIK